VRVGFLIDRWDPGRGGAEAALAALASWLERHGDEVAVFAREATTEPPGRDVRVRPRAFTRAGRERALARGLVDAARALPCDRTVAVRHVAAADLYWPHGGSHAASLEARARLRGGRARRRSAAHALYLELERELLDRGGARRVACVSSLVREELGSRHPGCRERLELVPNGVDLERFHPGRRAALGPPLRRRLGLDATTPLLAFAARDPLLKGLPELLDALALLSDRPWHLAVAGPRRERPWRRAAARRGLGPERVSVHASVDPEALFAAADLLAHPSWRDACGLVVLEALASGIPALTTALAGASEAVRAPDAGGVLADPSNAGALAAEIERWLGRIERGDIDRAAIRAAVLDRPQEPWLARLAALVHEPVAAR
jgi:UDP-glucose:(heptosyl)LPS alpha-1,3-glucosyltransferase